MHFTDYNKPAIEDYGDYYDRYDDYSKNEYTDNLEYSENEKSWNVDGNLISNNIFNTTVTKLIKYNHVMDGSLNTKNQSSQALKWPKFEDMLLEMGRIYDWKNDRWIKVKKKIKNLEKRKNLTSVHEKHKFIYRIVRLNRPKSKRNIVLAVTAVR